LTSPIPDVATPTTPTASVALTTGNYPQLSWTRSVDTGSAGLVGYRIIRDGVEIGSSLDPATLTYTDQTAAQGATYSYSVIAFDGAGNDRQPSNQVTVSVPDTTPPSVPTLSGALNPDNTVGLSWTASTDSGGSGLAGYRIYRDGQSTPYATITPDTTSYTDAGVRSEEHTSELQSPDHLVC